MRPSYIRLPYLMNQTAVLIALSLILVLGLLVIAVLDNTQASKLKKKLHNQRLHINLGNFHEIVLHDVPGSD
jgi:hypothetical protein